MAAEYRKNQAVPTTLRERNIPLPAVIATGKEKTLAAYRRALGEMLWPVLAFDPETLAFNFQKTEALPEHYLPEPANDDPKKTVEQKLARRLEEIIQQKLAEIGDDYVVLANDVSFRKNGEALHRLSRTVSETEDPHFRQAKEFLGEQYSRPFLAEWEVAFGLANKEDVSIGSVRILAQYPALTSQQIETYFDENANPGLGLVELGEELGVVFYLFLSDDTEPVICSTPELQQTVKQFVIEKVPTEEMVEILYQASIEQQLVQFGLLAQGLQRTAVMEQEAQAAVDDLLSSS